MVRAPPGIPITIFLSSQEAGDVAERHPVFLRNVAFAGAALLIREACILRPILSLLGFSPAGPLKGIAYPLLLSCTSNHAFFRILRCMGTTSHLRCSHAARQLVQLAPACRY